MKHFSLACAFVVLGAVCAPGQRMDAQAPVSWSSANIRSIAFSPRGDVVACGHLGGRVTLRNPRSGTLASTLRLPLRKHDAFGEVDHVAFSPGERLLAAGGNRARGQISRAVVAVWDFRSGKLIREFEGCGYVSSMAFAPNGREIAVAEGHSRLVRLWNIRSGKVTRSLTAPRNHMVSLACSPDGKLIAGGTASLDVHTEGDIIVWDTCTGRLKWSRSLPGAYVLRLAFSKTGDRIFAGLARWDHPPVGASQPSAEVAAWNTRTGRIGLRWKGGSESVSGLRLSPDGRLLAYCGYGNDSQGRANSGSFAVIDSATLKTIRKARLAEAVIDVAFSPDSKRVAVATENMVKIIPLSP